MDFVQLISSSKQQLNEQQHHEDTRDQDGFHKMARTQSGPLPAQLHSIVAKELFSQRYENGPKLILVMCGLPARGKSFIARKIKRYLSWTGYLVRVFNVGDKRRSDTLMHSESRSLSEQHGHQFFDPLNLEAKQKRELWALDTMHDILRWLDDGGRVAIHDATNSTLDRRMKLRQAALDHQSLVNNGIEYKVVFIESVCNDKTLMDANVKLKIHSPDYADRTPTEATADFYKRMDNYAKVYEPLGEAEEGLGMSYIQIINVGQKVVSFDVQGYLESQIVFYLMNVHVHSRAIWLTTHGESDNRENDADRLLTKEGHQYSNALGKLIRERYPPHTSKLEVWTSFLKRSLEMGEHLDPQYMYKHSRVLNELYPGEFALVKSDDYHQSLYIERLRSLIIDLEMLTSSVLIIARDTIISTLCAYFLDTSPKSAFDITTPLHTVVCLQPTPFGTEVYLFEYSRETGIFTEKRTSVKKFWEERLM